MRLGGAALALAGLALLPAGHDSASARTRGPARTDTVTVTDVFEPAAGSGVIAFYAKVTGTIPDGRRREYVILYMGRGQVLPAIGARCAITYRYGQLLDWADSNWRPLHGNIVSRFVCNDGRRWSSRTPHPGR
jgi:hypothetical protein